jgi:hypothetical protein
MTAVQRTAVKIFALISSFSRCTLRYLSCSDRASSFAFARLQPACNENDADRDQQDNETDSRHLGRWLTSPELRLQTVGASRCEQTSVGDGECGPAVVAVVAGPLYRK